MPNFFLIHGAFGNPEENWFPWLKNELIKRGHNVYTPTFPTPKNQSLSSWMNIFETYVDRIDKDTIFIGHSLGPAFIVQLLHQKNISIKACFFVSGFFSLLKNEIFDSINKSFVSTTIDWKKVHRSSEQFFLYHSNNDPYVPIPIAENFANKLHTNITYIKDAGHINTAAGYTTFSTLLDDILKITY